VGEKRRIQSVVSFLFFPLPHSLSRVSTSTISLIRTIGNVIFTNGGGADAYRTEDRYVPVQYEITGAVP
jgi:hypothetical protein